MIHCVNMSFEDDVQSYLYFDIESETKNMKPKVKALIKRVTDAVHELSGIKKTYFWLIEDRTRQIGSITRSSFHVWTDIIFPDNGQLMRAFVERFCPFADMSIIAISQV